MWLFTKHGFFSAVQDNYCNEDEVMVRARSKADLEALCKALNIPATAIATTPQADYRQRLKLTKRQWSEYVAGAAQATNYPNFKDTVDDCPRHDAYMKCWEALYQWQEDLAWNGKNKKI